MRHIQVECDGRIPSEYNNQSSKYEREEIITRIIKLSTYIEKTSRSPNSKDGIMPIRFEKHHG